MTRPSLKDGKYIFLPALVLVTAISAAFSQPSKPVYFEQVVEQRLSAGTAAGEFNFEKFCPVSTDVVAMRVLQSYGALFVAADSIKLPESCVYKGESEVSKFQQRLERRALEVNGIRVDLQAAAINALSSSISEAATEGLGITPLDGGIAGGRSYGDTLMLWNSRVFPAMEFWIRRGRLPESARDEIGRLDLQRKIEKVLEWESNGLFFSSDRSRSILTSTAPPGTSQHLYLAAFDVTEYWNSEVRAILNRNGWYQTVIDDPPHFTYLGFPESDLPSRGLIAVAKGGHQYWVPNLQPRPVSTN
jgi:hypothetical protein